MTKIQILLYWIFVIMVNAGYAQTLADSSLYDKALNEALSFYTISVGINAPIYSGGAAIEPRYPVNTGFAFYESADAAPGNITYDGITYRNVPMWYDLVNDEVSVLHPRYHSRVALNSSLISQFLFRGSLFLPRNPEIADYRQLTGKYYKVLHRNKTVLLGRYSKRISEAIRERRYATDYSNAQSEYFLQKDGRYYLVKSVPALLNILSDKKDLLLVNIEDWERRQRQGAAKGKDTPEQLMVRIIAYYDQISL